MTKLQTSIAAATGRAIRSGKGLAFWLGLMGLTIGSATHRTAANQVEPAHGPGLTAARVLISAARASR